MDKQVKAKIAELIESFSTIPFLFVGSGISRRYYNLPNWESLLRHFSQVVSNNDFKFSQYLSLSNKSFPKIGSLLEKDFNAWWFESSDRYSFSEFYLTQIKNGVSPFKCAVSQYIKEQSTINQDYANEISLFKEISSYNIAGFITTNYDDFLESHSDNYKKFSSQDELLFSSLQNIGEIYKIHGTVETPDSIVITEEDYAQFNLKSKYLAAKLLTIFVEYPIIFLGYSLSDPNMRKIIEDICDCLSEDKLNTLKNRFIIAGRSHNGENDISAGTLVVNDKQLYFTELKLTDFSILYSALKLKKSTLPVRVLRFFKNEFYSYVLSNTPTSRMRISYPEDNTINNDNLVMAIAAPDDFSKFGLVGISGPQWYSNYLTEDLKYTADELLDFAYPKLIKSNQKLPHYKYLQQSPKKHENITEKINTLDEILNNSILKRRKKITHKFLSLSALPGPDLRHNLNYIIDNITENFTQLDELLEFLLNVYKNTPSILSPTPPPSATEFKRLIRIYDWLKYGKEKTQITSIINKDDSGSSPNVI